MKKVFVSIPVKPSLHPEMQRRCMASALSMVTANPECAFTFAFDYRPIEKHPADCRPWSRVARARNLVLDTVNLTFFDYVLWIDADVVYYQPDMPSRLIGANPDGVTAPFVKVEGSETFYDWAAFIMKGRDHIEPDNRMEIPGRNLHGNYPYWPEPQTDEVVEMDCVGTVVLVPTDIYMTGVRYEDHPAFTDHYPICKRARDLGRKVCVHRKVEACHAYLPMYGEAWH